VLFVFCGNQLLERVLKSANGFIQCPKFGFEMTGRRPDIHMNQSAAGLFKT